MNGQFNRRGRRHAVFKKITPQQRREQLVPYIEERDEKIKNELARVKCLSNRELAELLITLKDRMFVWRIVKRAIKEGYYG